MTFHFEVGDYVDNAMCVDCGKEKECMQSRCKAGTFVGPICMRCLMKEGKKRTLTGRKNRPSGDNGELPMASPVDVIG